MTKLWTTGGWLVLLALAAPAACSGGSSGNNVTCGPGTALDGGVCYASGSTSTTTDASLGVDGAPGETGADAKTFTPFAGLTSVAPASSTALQVTWNAWQDPTTPASAVTYRVYVATAGGQENFSTPQVTSPPGATSVVIDSLQTSTKYFIIVRAVNSAGVEDSNKVEKNATTQTDTQAPTFAGATGLSTASESSVVITWAPASDDLTPQQGIAYYVYLALSAGAENLTAPSYVSDLGATSVTIPALPMANTTYFAVVRARDASGNIDTNTVEVSGKSGTDTTPPVFAGCTSAVTKDAAAITVTWDAATDDTTPEAQIAYDVYASKTPGGEDFTTPAATFTGKTVGLVDNLYPGTTYYLVCRARDLSGNEDANTSERIAATLVDTIPPVFAGVTGTANVTASTVDLVWSTPATDSQTPQSGIVYVVYDAATSGAQVFTGAPIATSTPGATGVTVTGLGPETTHYFVVRARNRAGLTDSNTKEVTATTTVSFQQNVVTIFANHCAVQGCHVPGNPPPPCGGMILAPSFAYANIVSVPACETALQDGGVDPYMRIFPGDPTKSLLYLKITATQTNLPPGGGQPMPFPTSNDHLSTTEIQIIHDWIQQGALQN